MKYCENQSLKSKLTIFIQYFRSIESSYLLLNIHSSTVTISHRSNSLILVCIQTRSNSNNGLSAQHHSLYKTIFLISNNSAAHNLHDHSNSVARQWAWEWCDTSNWSRHNLEQKTMRVRSLVCSYQPEGKTRTVLQRYVSLAV